ncbi:hypothetical protein RN001_002087 [Aquatica leii]|uniref:Uncharacterized protein n=1 Tax=Aquatica leii TaxID=1421715 RepID=A0AAN7PPF4_9COLE|nr:hypothetical protein RN001_002087 [Aquatica leii]
MRKRRRSEIRDEIFDKSRKTQRSPNKTQSDDGKLDLLVKMVQGLTEDVKLVRIQQEQYNVEMLKIQEENAKLRKENDNIKKENQEIKRKKFIKDYLEVEAKVKDAITLGTNVCLVKLENGKDKEKIMINKTKLGKIPNEKISINDDLTKKEREKQNQLRKKAAEEKKHGKNVKLGYNKITIDGVVWKWNKDKEILEEIKIRAPVNIPKN